MAVRINQKELEHLEDLPDRQCQNCDFVYDGFFCPRCGQRYMEGRFKFKESTQWVMWQVFNLDKGFFYTILELLLRPKHIISDYLDKATIRYMHPFRFAFIIATLSALLTALSGTFESPEVASLMQGKSKEEIALTQNVLEVLQKYMSLILVISIPFYSIATKLIYRNIGLNYTEHLIVNSYAYALSLVLGWPFLLLVLLPNGLYWEGVLSTIVSFLGIAWVYSSYFNEHFLIAFIKTIGATIIASIVAILIALPLGLLGAVFFKYFT